MLQPIIPVCIVWFLIHSSFPTYKRMPRIQQPVASVKLTNVATVRLTVDGHRFEIACYKNKILDYRAGLETDLSEVLQTDRIFSNVVKGEFASTADMNKAFGKDATEEEIAVIILNKGKSLQVSEAERTQLYESTLTQVATWLATNCFHKSTGKPYTMSQVKQALTSTTFSVQPHKPIKQQYLQALKHLQAADVPIQRAAMELSWTYSSNDEEKVRKLLKELNITPSKEESNKLILTVDPSLYRPLNQKAPSDSMIEVLRQHVMDASTTGDLPVTNDLNEVDVASTPAQNKTSLEIAPDDSSDDSSIDVSYVHPSSRSKKKKGKKKQQRKAERRQQQRAAAESSDDSKEEPVRATPVVAQPVANEQSNDETVKTWKCNSCPGSSFVSAAEHRAHFKTDWHRFNQKLKMKGASTVTEEEFRSCDIDSFFGDDLNN